MKSSKTRLNVILWVTGDHLAADLHIRTAKMSVQNVYKYSFVIKMGT